VVVVGGMIAVGAYLIRRAFYSLELSDDGFAIRTFGKKDYRCASFAGYRRFMTRGRYGTDYRYVLVGSPGQRDVTIHLDKTGFSSEDRDRLDRWITRFPDLESADLDREEAERRERSLHPDSGPAPLSRERARRIARALTVAAVLVMACPYVLLLTSFTGTAPAFAVRIAMGIATCLVLPAAVALKVWQPDAFQLGAAIDARLPPSVAIAFTLGSLAPIISAVFGYRPVRWESAIPAGLAAAALVGLPLFRRGLRRVDRTPRILVSAAAWTLAYGYFAVLTLNGALDGSRPALLSATVRDRWETQGRGHSYKLLLEWRDDQGTTKSLAVPQRVYARSAVGGEVRIAVGPGALRIPWIAGVLPPE
jgi:hypothetical protein